MDRNLLILGASSDLATTLIPRVAENFGTIYAHYHRSADRLVALKETVPCEMKLFQADFINEEETKWLMNAVEADGGNITHILHCPSARLENKHFRKMCWDDYSIMLNTQLRSLYYATRQFVPIMAKKKYGKVVAILSSATTGTPPAYMNAYITAKYAQMGFIRSLAAEYADKSIQINAVSPSMIETKFLKDMPHLLVEQNAVNHPLGRNAKVEDIVPAIEFLLSDESRFITGQNLLISGGCII